MKELRPLAAAFAALLPTCSCPMASPSDDADDEDVDDEDDEVVEENDDQENNEHRDL